MLSILAGATKPDEGIVNVKRGTSLAYVSQDLPAVAKHDDETVLQAVLRLAGTVSNNEAVRTTTDYLRLITNIEHGVDEAKLARMTGRMDVTPGAWEVEPYIHATLSRFELMPDWVLARLSGGQRRRVSIVAALIAKPDVLLLDEITNHLSVDAILYLEQILADPMLTLVAISHDRYFVDSVCTTGIWEMTDGRMEMFQPGYDNYVTAKEERLRIDQGRARDLAGAYKKELAWIRKQPKARGTKSRSRLERAEKMKTVLDDTRRRVAQSGVKGLVSGSSRLGGEIVELENVTLRRGDQCILKDFSYVFEKGERVGVVGGNGVGKSSFLKALVGELEAEGKIRVGKTVKFGYFDQMGLELSDELTEASKAVWGAGGEEVRVVDYVAELLSLAGAAERVGGRGEGDVESRLDDTIEELSYSRVLPASRRKEVNNPLVKMSPVALLDHFGFDRAKQYSMVAILSGGERRRLQLIALLLRNANFLVLDEVSNDLDVQTLSMLEELLDAFDGVLVLCSHDRFMVDRLVDHLIVLNGNGEVELFQGRFSEYLDEKEVREIEERRKRKEASRVREKKVGKKKMSYKEKREYEGLESEIATLEERLAELGRLLEQGSDTGYEQLATWTEELAHTEEEIDSKTGRWLDLAELGEC